MRLIRGRSGTAAAAAARRGAGRIGSTTSADGRSASAAAFCDYIWWRYEFHADDERRERGGERGAGDEWGGETRWGAARGGDARVCVRCERE